MTRQFDVIPNPELGMRTKAPYLVVLQSHLLDGLGTLVCAPLLLPEIIPPDGVVVLDIQFHGARYALDVSLLTSLPTKLVRRSLGNIGEVDYEIRRALDRLFTGF